MEKPTENPHKSQISYRPDIDGLRAVAVIAVFIFHAFPSLLRGGFVGVDFFFVISGFLISSIIFTQLDKGTFTFWNFYSRRIRRIYPVLLTVLISCFLVGCWFLVSNPLNGSLLFITPSSLEQLSGHIAAGAGFVSNIVLWMESGYFDAQSVLKPLLHLWSLGIEEQFYILWPFLLWFGFKRRWNLFAVCAVIFVCSFGFNLYEYKANPTADFYSPLTRFWELVAGAMLAWLTVNRGKFADGSFGAKIASFLLPQEPGKKAQILSTLGFILVLVSVFLIKTTASRGFPGAWALVPVTATVLVISAGANGWFNRYVLSNRILVWLGLISYPLYLWHWPLLSFAHLVSNKNHLPVWYSALAFPLCVLLAWATTRFIEHPLRFGEYGKQKTIGLFLAMIVVGAGAFFAAKGLTALSKNTAVGRLVTILDRTMEKQRQVSQQNLSGTDKARPGIDAPAKTPASPTPAVPKPVLVVLGDSHAGHIEYGLKKHLSDKWEIIVRSHGGCPMVPKNKKAKECDAHYTHELEYVTKTKPQKVLLAADYSSPIHKVNWDDLKITIDALRSAGIHDIVIVGQSPNYESYLPQQVILAHRKAGSPDGALPKRIKNDFSRDIKTTEQFKVKAKQWGVAYISLFEAMCNSDGCLAFTSDDPESLTSFDDNHLTENGSSYAVSAYKDHPALQPKGGR